MVAPRDDGGSYAETGDFSNAILFQRQCIELAPESRVTESQLRLELYMRNEPYRGLVD